MYLLLYALWLILCGSLRPDRLIAGLIAVLLCALLMWALFGYTPRRELSVWKKLPFLAAYAGLVIAEVVKANFRMMSLILQRSRKASPALVCLDTELETPLGRFLLANCITLTPGTITVKAEEGRFFIHAMEPESLMGMEESRVVKLLKRMEAVR